VHELSIAMSIIEAVEEEAARHGGRQVNAVHLRIGQLSGVVPEALRSSFDLAAEDTTLAGTRLVIEETPVLMKCAVCDAIGPIRSMQEFCCAACGEAATEIVGGRELLVTALELEA
jgi:hydrogenase nickel incorporation protein HypA/HybF